MVVKPQPVIELSRFILEALWKDEEFILYRGRGESDASQVLVLSPGVEYPTPGEWETQRRIDEFPLSEHDTPDRLLIPEKLYGRAHEIDTLLASFDRVVASFHKYLRFCDLCKELAFGSPDALRQNQDFIQLARAQHVLPPVPGERHAGVGARFRLFWHRQILRRQ